MQGIYAIINKNNNKKYIGSSIDIDYRWEQHINMLNGLYHPNSHLQNAWNKYGEEKFTFNVVEIVSDLDCILAREQFWIDIYWNMKKCYNGRKSAANNSGMMLSEESKRKISNSVKALHENPEYRKHFPQTRIDIADKMRSKTAERWKDPEYRKNIATKNSKSWNGFVSPDGMEYRDIVNLSEFCKTHNLAMSAMHLVAKGKLNHHQGWMLIERPIDAPKPRAIKNSIFEFLSPDGDIYENITNLRSFCEEHNLAYRTMAMVYSGKVISHRGWQRIDRKPSKRFHCYDILSPEGILYEKVFNLAKFSREHNLHHASMCKLSSGKYSQHHGWKIIKVYRKED